jgi:hypothetical protein
MIKTFVRTRKKLQFWQYLLSLTAALFGLSSKDENNKNGLFCSEYVLKS